MGYTWRVQPIKYAYLILKSECFELLTIMSLPYCLSQLVDKCDVNKDGCEHICKEIDDVITCLCHPGWQLIPGTKKCEGQSDLYPQFVCKNARMKFPSTFVDILTMNVLI